MPQSLFHTITQGVYNSLKTTTASLTNKLTTLTSTKLASTKLTVLAGWSAVVVTFFLSPGASADQSSSEEGNTSTALVPKQNSVLTHGLQKLLANYGAELFFSAASAAVIALTNNITNPLFCATSDHGNMGVTWAGNVPRANFNLDRDLLEKAGFFKIPSSLCLPPVQFNATVFIGDSEMCLSTYNGVPWGHHYVASKGHTGKSVYQVSLTDLATLQYLLQQIPDLNALVLLSKCPPSTAGFIAEVVIVSVIFFGALSALGCYLRSRRNHGEAEQPLAPNANNGYGSLNSGDSAPPQISFANQ